MFFFLPTFKKNPDAASPNVINDPVVSSLSDKADLVLAWESDGVEVKDFGAAEVCDGLLDLAERGDEGCMSRGGSGGCFSPLLSCLALSLELSGNIVRPVC